MQRIMCRVLALPICSFVLATTLTGCADNSLSSILGGNTATSSSQASDACSGASLAQQSVQTLSNRFIVHWQDGHVSVESAENKELFVRRFVTPNMALIKHVENDQVVQVRGVHVDATTTSSAPTSSQTWGPTIIQASSAWSQNITGSGVLVGVVDAAVDYSQPQIQPRLAGNTVELNGKTGVDDDANGFVDDYYGWDFEQNTNNPSALVSSSNEHATHVSGIIAADHSAGPVQGIAPGAQIVPVNFMDATGSGSLGQAILGIQYAASRGVKVINASWGGPVCSQTLKNVIGGLAAQNVLVVVAAGNDGEDLDSNTDYPTSFNFPNQINVASTNSSDFLDSWSNSGYSVVHLGAPGDTIFSTVPGATQGYMSGTSMAAPFVTGTAALLWSLRPTATYAQIRQAILDGADNKGLRVQTYGRLNVSNSIQALLKAVP